MRKMLFLSLVALVFALLTINNSIAANSFEIEQKKPLAFSNEDLPDILKDWSKWSLDGIEKTKCDFAYNNFNDKFCYYISNLEVDINGKEASFVQDVKILEKGYVLLPGSVDVFPVKISVNGKEQNIISKHGRPYIHLDKGTYRIAGILKSKENIRYIFIPENSTIINIKKAGKILANPTIENGGVVRLEAQSTTKSETDDISVFVYRKITDNIPILMTVRLNLNVTGKERVENLGRIIPENFSLVEINSLISTYIQKNGDLIAEVKPGYSTIDIILRQNVESLSFVLDNSPIDQEIWVFEGDESRRAIQAPVLLHSVQTQNVPMPDEWKRLPAYEILKDKEFTLKAIEHDKKNNDILSLSRDIKLSFDGKFYSIKDNINANFREDGRLLLISPFKFYSSSIDGQPQAITYTSENKEAGVEVRKGNANIINILRVDNEKDIFATGYNREFSNVTWNLDLSPGYDLFYAAGVDTVSNSWVSNWNLLSVFIVALLAVCFFYLFGFVKSFFGLLLLILLHPIFPHFTSMAFILCGLLFLQRNIKPEFKMYGVVSYVRNTLLLFLSVAVFMFVIKHLRSAIYPALGTEFDSVFLVFINYKFLIFFYLYSFIAYVVYKIFTRESYEGWRKVVYTIGMFFITIFVTSFIAALFSNFNFIIGGSASPSRYYETQNYGYADASLRQSPRMMAKSYDEYIIEESAELLEYDSVSATEARYYKNSRVDMKSSLSGVKNKASNISQKLLNDVSMKKYQSVNVARNVAQTGVGFPTWNNNASSIFLYLKGPVTNDDSFKLYLISPAVNIALAFIRVIILLFVFYWLADVKKTKVNLSNKGKDIMKKLFAASIFGFMLFSSLSVKASDVIPPNDVIKKMEDKLSREYVPSCLPECVSIPNGVISNVNDNVIIEFEYHSNEDLVVPLPILRVDGSGFVKLEKITINGEKTENALRKYDNIFVLINKGINRVVMSYLIDENSDRFILSSTVRINNMVSKLEGLSFSENKSGNQTFQINRVKKAATVRKTSELSKMDIDTFFTINRNFDINAMWQVSTDVVRKNNLSEAATIEIPLLNGEKVIDTDGSLSSGKIRISFAPRETIKTYASLLPVEQNIELKAPEKIGNYKEEWSFNVDYTWSFKYSGLSPVVSEGENLLFKPNAGDILDFKIFRPNNIEDGYVITFDKVDYNISYGRGVIDINLALNFRASDSGVHNITIPENAEIKNLSIYGRPYPVTVNGNQLTIPVVQGNNSVKIEASIKNPLGTVVRFPEFNLNAPVVNINQSANVPLSRWVVFTSGPVKGPSVLFWSMIPAWIIIAYVLSRFKAAPVSFTQWFILLLGLTQTSMIFIVFIVAWFIVVGIREKFSEVLKFKKLFQLVIPVMTLLFIYSLFNGIYSGLLGNWSMKIVGNAYVNGKMLNLLWYQDAVTGSLPMPTIISFPVWVYRCFMVIWSTWLAIYFVKWIKWGFQSYIKDSAWSK